VLKNVGAHYDRFEAVGPNCILRGSVIEDRDASIDLGRTKGQEAKAKGLRRP
jgi:hypothetical protein